MIVDHFEKNNYISPNRIHLDNLLPDTITIDQKILDIETKERQSMLSWRGQFNPMLIEALLEYSSLKENSLVFDPFCGSGTTIFECARKNINAIGTDINPAAYFMSELVYFCNISWEERIYFFNKNEEDFLESELNLHNIYKRNIKIASSKTKKDPNEYIKNIIISLPFSNSQFSILRSDARSVNIGIKKADLIITSPPYINVFNYHQNSRNEIEELGIDILKIAKSEIGSNRANRGNRFLTVVQYCIDMAFSIHNTIVQCNAGAKVIFIVGRVSSVRGIPFYNSQIIVDIFVNIFNCNLEFYQERKFINKFGVLIYEDILHFNLENCTAEISKKIQSESNNNLLSNQYIEEKAREISREYLEIGANNPNISEEVLTELYDAILKSHNLNGTPILGEWNESTSQK